LKKKILFSTALLFFASSCSRYYLNCDRQKRDTSYLASSFTQAPDPTNPFDATGEQLVITWHIPQEFVEKAQCVVDMTYWDYTQKQISFTLNDRLGAYRLKNLGKSFEDNKGLVAFKAVILDPNGQVYKTWEHQLYCPIINVQHDEKEEIDQDNVDEEEEWDWDSSL
jgi:hypothetical protein